jgi:hypothetical protein
VMFREQLLCEGRGTAGAIGGSRICGTISGVPNKGTVADVSNWYKAAADIVDQMLLSSF